MYTLLIKFKDGREYSTSTIQLGLNGKAAMDGNMVNLEQVESITLQEVKIHATSDDIAHPYTS